MGELNTKNAHTTQMKQYALIFYIIILLINSQDAKSQEADALKSHIPNITVASPQAASISKVGEIPIDISTGRMNYTIPIFEIKEGDFSMPINLSYNYSGLLLDEAPGYAGVGWTFNIGGSILHSINGLDDTNREYQKEWVYKYVNKLPPYDDYISPSGKTTINHYLESLSNGIFDGEPDKYIVNAGNLNCSFYLDKDNNAIFLKNSSYKVTGYSYNGFTVTDEKGTNYIFDILQGSGKSVGAESSIYTSSFLLREINFPTTSNKITFEYSNNNYLSDLNVSQTLTSNSTLYVANQGYELITHKTYSSVDSSILTKITTNDYTIELQYNNNPTESGVAVISNLLVKNKANVAVKSYDFVYSGWTGKRTNLLKVKFNGQIINEMEYDTSTPYPVMTADSDYVKKDLWGYYNKNGRLATYSSTTLPDDNPYLKPDFSSTKIGALTKILYQTKGYSLIEYEPNMAYLRSIDYNLPYESDGTVTTRGIANTSAHDGITDEKTFTVTTVPTEVIIRYLVANQPEITQNQEQRDTKVLLLKEGDDEANAIFSFNKTWLKELTWIPQTNSFTGTEKKVINNPGTYRIKAISGIGSTASIDVAVKQRPDHFNQTVGGIRVKQVKNCDFNDECITTVYNYSQENKSTGVMLQRPQFYSGYHIQDNMGCSPPNYIRRDFYNFTSIFPLSNFRGSPVLYSAVEKIDSGTYSNNQPVNNGKTIFYYYGQEMSNSLQAEHEYFAIGLLSAKLVKDQNNNLKAKQKNDYLLLSSIPDNNKILYVLNTKIVREKRIYGGGGAMGDCMLQYPRPLLDFQAAWFRYQPRNYMLQKEENINYYANDSIVQSTTFDYDLNLTSLKSKKVVNSKGETLETKYLYPTDSEMSSEPFVSELISKNRIGTPLAVRSYNTNKLSDQKIVYAKDASTANLLLPKYVYANKGADAIDSAKDKKVTYDQYDDKGNILQYTLENGMPVSIIWGYNKTQPVAKIENAVYSLIPVGTITNLQSLSDADHDNCVSASCKEQLLRNALDTFRATFPNAFISTYTYNPLIGVTSITDPRGNVSYYEYDALGRLQFVKDKDLNVLQKYCYNYKGQQIDCDISFASGTVYKSTARSGSFTRNNCASGEVGSSVTYNQAQGVETSTVSQADADSKGLTRFNTDGQAYANTNGTCSIPTPAAPTGLTFTSATAASLNFSWTAVAGAASYKIYKNGTDTGITSATNTGSLSGLTASTAYSIQIQAVNASGNSALSTAVLMTTASAPVSNTCTLNFSRESGTSYMYKNGSSYLTRSTSGTSSGTLSSGDTFYVMVSAASTYYKSIIISSSVRGALYSTLIRTGSSVTSPTFTKTGSEVITIDCTTSTEP
ncbi:DUF5977 domain-containing protein [Flavobacterium chungangense]|uniref:Fibronectin type-III domain-containing protein n=1 Tax=Flavobacterium chungangense TaxID=554283 RepID=A0A6V6YRP1_9FLAO|nr:DUF5977 domain-containing protein [Flavobacterium chungangense]CAD0002113.1 hypothetical protein FLACHUCJ7_00836 [Flavobacterium chungangense]